MSPVKATIANPHALTSKQAAVIELATKDIKEGKSLNLARAHNQIYDTKGNGNVLANENLQRLNFRQAFLERIREEGIDKKIENRYVEGLDSKDALGQLDRRLILDYANSLAKIIGLNAPTQVQRKTLSATINLSSEELQEELEGLAEELRE